MIHLSSPELRALISGECVVAFAERGAVSVGDEIELRSTLSIAATGVKPAYRRWLSDPVPDGTWTAIVESVDPASILDPVAGQSRHVRTEAPTSGDLILLRVYGPDGPVLSDVAFDARQTSVEGALHP